MDRLTLRVFEEPFTRSFGDFESIKSHLVGEDLLAPRWFAEVASANGTIIAQQVRGVYFLQVFCDLAKSNGWMTFAPGDIQSCDELVTVVLDDEGIERSHYPLIGFENVWASKELFVSGEKFWPALEKAWGYLAGEQLSDDWIDLGLL